MKLNFSHERILAVVAHPDDAELLCAGTLARAKQDDAAVAIAALCRGDKGQPPEGIDDLAEVRRMEATDSASLLGGEFIAGFSPDGELADTVENRRQLVEVFLNFRPTLVLTHAKEDYHPDHRAASALADAVSWFCASHAWSGLLAPLERPPALWHLDCIDRHGFTPGFYIDVSEFVDLKARMLTCHASQLARAADPAFVSLLDLMRSQQRARGAEAGVAAAEAFRIHRSFRRTKAW